MDWVEAHVVREDLEIDNPRHQNDERCAALQSKVLFRQTAFRLNHLHSTPNVRGDSCIVVVVAPTRPRLALKSSHSMDQWCTQFTIPVVGARTSAAFVGGARRNVTHQLDFLQLDVALLLGT